MTQPPILTSVAAVMYKQPNYLVMESVARNVEAFLDTTKDYTLAHATKFHSIRLLQRIAARQAQQWATLSPLLVKSYRQEQFVDAMTVLATCGFLAGAQWLYEVYFSEERVLNAANLAAKNGHAGMLEWLLNSFPEDQTLDLSALIGVLSDGHVDVLRVMWKHNKHEGYSPKQINVNVDGTQLLVIQFLHEHFPEFVSTTAMKNAASNGNMEALLWLHDRRAEPFTEKIYWNAVAEGHLEIVKYIHTHHPHIASFSNRMMNVAATHGHLEMLKWLYANRTEEFVALDTFGGFGFWVTETDRYWDVCKWLLAHYCSCPSQMIEIAIVSGNLPMLQWLHDHYRKAFDVNIEYWVQALPSKGHLYMMQWLYKEGFQFGENAIYLAAANEHLAVVRWLHASHPHLLAEGALHSAGAQRGNLELVKFLHENRTEGCTADTMTLAAANNYLDVVQFLHENRTEGCTTGAMDNAPTVEILEFLYRNRTEGCTTSACAIAAATGRLAVLEWLYKYKRELVDLKRVREAAETYQRYHIEYWVDAMEANG